MRHHIVDGGIASVVGMVGRIMVASAPVVIVLVSVTQVVHVVVKHRRYRKRLVGHGMGQACIAHDPKERCHNEQRP